MLTTTKSAELFEKLEQVIPGGANSPIRSFKGLEIPPVLAEKGEGDLLTDVNGKTYIDYCLSWGPLILGHAHPKVMERVEKRMKLGTTFGLSTEVEYRLAQKVVDLVPSIDKVRFVSSGTEATMSAVRLARGYTGKNLVIKFTGNYHGHADSFLIKAGSGMIATNREASSAGVPVEMVKYTVSLDYNDIEGLRAFCQSVEVKENLAAIILEPIAGNMGVVPASKAFIDAIFEVCQEHQALVIFDEVISGFRPCTGGAQEMLGVRPDLTCLGKIVGGGFPAAAFGGKEEIMNFLAPLGNVYQAGTLSGNPIAMEAGYQTLCLLEGDGFYEELEEKTRFLTDPITDLIAEKNLNMCLQRAGSLFTLFFGKREVHSFEDVKGLDIPAFNRFLKKMLEEGIYPPPSQYEAWFVSSAHTQAHLLQTRDAILNYLV